MCVCLSVFILAYQLTGGACHPLLCCRDMLVQHIQNDHTARAYELHASIALEAGDLNEFNQCQTQLKILHAQGLGMERRIEFTACRLLYFVVVDSKLEMTEAMVRFRIAFIHPCLVSFCYLFSQHVSV